MKEEQNILYEELKANNFRTKFYGKNKTKYPYGMRKKYIRIPTNVSLPEDIEKSYKGMTLELFKHMEDGQVLMRNTRKGYVPIDKKWIAKKFNLSESRVSKYIASLKKHRIIDEIMYIKRKEKMYIVNPKYCINNIFIDIISMYIFQDDMELSAYTKKEMSKIVKEQEIDKEVRSVKNGR